MANYAPRRTDYGTGDRRWLPDLLKAETHGVTLDGDAFPAGTVVPSGTFLSRGAGGLSGPYAGGDGEDRVAAEGLLVNDQRVEPGGRYHVAAVHGGTVHTQYLPENSGVDAAGRSDLTTIAFI